MSLKNPVTPPGINPRTVRLVERLNHYATPGPELVDRLAKEAAEEDGPVVRGRVQKFPA